MDVFIVRPFGKKTVSKKDIKTGQSEEIILNFDKVEEVLILPALQAVNLVGGTTGKIFEPGDIREDMFSLLLLADVVIADITIHNANVFYELGIRHALRDKKTILIKSPGFDETPFDILGYKYVSYIKDDPAAALAVMIKTLQDTMITNRTDSPVFNMLPQLKTQDPEYFLAVPPDFGEEVEIAVAARQMGKLALLAGEAEGFAWEIPALKMVGEAQYNLNNFIVSKQTLEKVRNRNPNDIYANDRLATIYQRLAETVMKSDNESGLELLTKSNQAIERVEKNLSKTDSYKKAEIFSLKARNAKTRWVDSWKNIYPALRKKEALKSTYLKDSFQYYEQAYNLDLNHFYSGINALGLLTVIISLAESQESMWQQQFDNDEDAELTLKKYREKHQKLSVSVQFSVEAEKKRIHDEGKKDRWLAFTEADLACLLSKKPERVATLYEQAISEASNLNFEAATRQLLIYEQLQVLPENVQAALSAFEDIKISETTKNNTHYLLFTGHMIDKPGRKEPRFPPSKEEIVKAAIKQAVQKAKDKTEGTLTAIAGGACGGDILFHEVCNELGIKSKLLLALPRELFIQESVAFAGSDWVERFDKIIQLSPPQILSDTKQLPQWLQKKPDYSIWQRNNLWMLNASLVCGGANMTLIALWDGKTGDAAGGTEHMVKVAKARGAKTMIIDINSIN